MGGGGVGWGGWKGGGCCGVWGTTLVVVAVLVVLGSLPLKFVTPCRKLAIIKQR